ncbi:hypothetical protein EYF80_005656 [Liparis tanakae]|uniref:Uncharacterized protein n=1 Tax=Liparis tanakae TaxID=230148 RepID=A0A4Z2J191_9TELE|nr:hypothetical protein EYF80_005656 [Liparis tanakae]
MWSREEPEADPSAEGMIERSTGPEELNDTRPNSVYSLKQMLTQARDHCLWLVTERRVMRFYGQQREGGSVLRQQQSLN